MNWQLPLALAQANEELRKAVENTTLPGTTVPDSALERTGTSNPFVAEYWFPSQASSFAAPVDDLFMAIFWISLAFFIPIVVVMVYFCIKYRRKDGVIAPEPSPSHNTAIEILWSVLPGILLVWIFYVGATGYFQMRVEKEGAEEIYVTASQFAWLFTYPNGNQSAELHLVRDRPVRLIMQSEDVLHSFFVPAFRQKMDIVPGRYTYAYLEPTELGQFRLSCNEYCGEGHSKMRTLAQVHLNDEERNTETNWIEAKYFPWKNGERTYQIHCAGCHRVDGVAATGPALNLIWGEQENTDKGTVKVDEEYILESIWEPNAKIVNGYAPKMNSFKGVLDPQAVNNVIAYLKRLKDGPAEGQSAEDGINPDYVEKENTSSE